MSSAKALNVGGRQPMGAVAFPERKDFPMSMRIGSADGSARWGTHAAWVHLRRDSQQLAADVAANADQRVIAADKAAVVESRQQVASRLGTHLVDVTV
jgi:hypothetical protein